MGLEYTFINIAHKRNIDVSRNVGGIKSYCNINNGLQAGKVDEAGKDTNKENVLFKIAVRRELKGSLAEERLFLEANQI